MVFHSRMKHVQIDVYFVREKVECGEVEIRYVPTSDKWQIYLLKDCLETGLSSYVKGLV